MSTARSKTVQTATMLLVLLVTLFRFAWEVNTPSILLWHAGHDDGLFMQLGAYMASGQWLGPFNRMTLAKGPGYPAFLAFVIASGISVSVLHSLFAIAAMAVAALAVHRLTGSRVVALLFFLFLVLLPLPTSFQPGLHRIIRDQIYWGQTLIFYSTFAVLLFAPPGRWSIRVGLAVCCGLILGWAWLTREEGIWLIPGIAILLTGKAVERLLGKRPLGPAVKASTIVALGFIAVVTAFMTANWFVYGSFVGVDFNERNFQRTLAALQSVDDSDRVPRVPVSDKTLALVAEASPSFRPLADVLRPGAQLDVWRVRNCQPDLNTCGRMSGGHFVWALRDAAALNDLYFSPEAASRGFGKIADEIAAACDGGVLKCRPSTLSSIPPMSAEQWHSVPYNVLIALGRISLWKPAAFGIPPLPHDSEAFYQRWRLLNYPRLHMDSNNENPLFGPDARSDVAMGIGKALTQVYTVLFPATLGVGLACFVLCVAGNVRDRSVTPLLVVAAAAWTAVLARAVLIALVDVSSFYAIDMLYLAPAVPMAAFAAFLSIYALARRIRAVPPPA